MEYHPSSYSPKHYSPTDQRKIESQAREEGLFTPVLVGHLLAQLLLSDPMLYT